MRNVILLLVVIGIFVLGFFVVKLLNRFIKNNRKDFEETKNKDLFSSEANENLPENETPDEKESDNADKDV